MDSYNLLDKCWIPVLRTNGDYNRVGIMEALTQAGRIRQIAATNPMDRVAVIRFLLALLYWCKKNPPKEPVPGEGFPPEWLSKAEKERDFFNLLGEGKRFYQYKIEGDTQLTANYLMHEVPRAQTCGISVIQLTLSMASARRAAALGLLRLPLFTTKGGQGKSPGINAKPPYIACA